MAQDGTYKQSRKSNYCVSPASLMKEYAMSLTPAAVRPAAIPFILTCCTGRIGVMKSHLKGVIDMLAPVSKIKGTMSGVIGVTEP